MAPGVAESTAGPTDDPVSLMSGFFNRLVDLIPARFYRSTDRDERLDLAHMKKGERAEAQTGIKAKARAAKRAKLGGDDEEPFVANGDSHGHSSAAIGPSSAAGAAMQQRAPLLNIGGGAGTPSREQLHEKLAAKLEAMRAQRSSSEKANSAQKAKDWKAGALADNAKRIAGARGAGAPRQAKGSAAGVKRPAEGAPGGSQPAIAGGHAPGGKQPAAVRADASALEFPRIELDSRAAGGKGPHGGTGAAKKQSKAALLRAAEAKAQSEDAAGVDEGAWRAAAARASGQKVLDDPKLLRKSLKKEAKRKEKSSQAWAQRAEQQKAQQDKRQSKRTENLRRRREGKVAKKVERREKKLLGSSSAGRGAKQQRAGFEGRRDSFIGER